MNALRDAINDMRRERGENPLTEEELPAEPDNAVCRWWYYYDHVVQGLPRRLDKGERPEHGTVAWWPGTRDCRLVWKSKGPLSVWMIVAPGVSGGIGTAGNTLLSPANIRV